MMTKKTTAKLCGVIRDGLKYSPRHTADCIETNQWDAGCTQECFDTAIRRSKALAALDQLEAVLPLEK